MSKASEWANEVSKIQMWASEKIGERPEMRCGPYLRAFVSDGGQSVAIQRESSGKLNLTIEEGLALARWILVTFEEKT